MLLLIKKEKKIIAIIINASNSSTDFYFVHFDEAEDIPQSCMLIFFTKLNNGLFKFHLSQKLSK